MGKAILLIRDGWGYRKSLRYNALENSKKPFTDYLMKTYPNVLIQASGKEVGLPKGYTGNSEVGHMTIGAGRIINQTLSRINSSILDGSFFKKRGFLNAINNCKKHKSSLHIMGLIQEEGVHSHINHLFALLDLCKKEKFQDIFLHLITDGRDSPPKKGIIYLRKIEKKIKKIGFGKIITLSGRYYSMDRNNFWERTKKAYQAVGEGKSSKKFKDPKKYLLESYSKKITDEFLIPACHKNYKGIQKNDSFIFYNYRTDRPRQIIKSLTEKNFNFFKTKKIDAYFVSMTEYYKNINTHSVFHEPKIKKNLGEIISNKGLSQLRISETEKYAHVTFFFNSQTEKPNKGEKRILVPSPNIKTYDLKPQMSIKKVTEKLLEEIEKEKYSLIIVNLVNADMVGHTSNVNAIKKAINALDEATEKIVKIGLEKDYTFLITADHGNAEDQTKRWRTSHTGNPVQTILVSNKNKFKKVKLKKNKGLKDIAPTILKIMNIEKPKEMTGTSLI